MRKVASEKKPRKKKEESEEDILRGLMETGHVVDDMTYSVSGKLLKELLSIREG